MATNTSASFTRINGSPSLTKIFHEPFAELYLGKLVVESFTASYIQGSMTSAETASYVDFADIANKPALISSSIQIISFDRDSYTFSEITASAIQVQTLHVQTITSSVVYSSGSTHWGTFSTDKHQFTGSVSVSGSFAVNGVGNGILTATGTPRTITGTANQVVVTNGDGVAGNPTLSLPQSIATTAFPQFGRLGIGVAPSAASLEIESGTGTRPGPITNNGIRMTVADSNQNSIESYGWGAAPLRIVGRRASGTRAAPTAVTTGLSLLNIEGTGYDGTTHQTSAASSINLLTNGDWSGTNRGTQIAFQGTPLNSTTLATWMTLANGLLRLHNYTGGLLATDTSGNVLSRTIMGTTDQVVVTNGDGVSGSPTLSLPQSIATTSAPRFAGVGVDGEAGSFRLLQFYTENVRRINVGTDGAVESGANAGSNFQIYRFDDAGNSLGAALFIRRSTGNVGIGTTTPTAKLTITGTDQSTDCSMVHFKNSNSNYPLLQILPWTTDNISLNFDAYYDYAWYSSHQSSSYSIAKSGNLLRFRYNTGTPSGSTFTSWTDAMVVNTSGNVGIGTTSPSAKLEVNVNDGQASMTTGLYVFDSANTGYFVADLRSNWTDNNGGDLLRVRNASGNAILVKNNRALQLAAYGAGTLITDSSGNVTATSDGRMKDVSGSFDRGLDAIINLSPKVYHWKEESGLNADDVNVGLIAQEVLPYIPEAIGYKDDKYTMSDRPIISALINAVKELKADNDVLRSRIDSLGG